MAKDQTPDKDFATTAAEAVGRTLGSIVGTVDRLRSEHPHPVSEAKEMLAQGRAGVAKAAAGAKSILTRAGKTARRTAGKTRTPKPARATRHTPKTTKKATRPARKKARR